MNTATIVTPRFSMMTQIASIISFLFVPRQKAAQKESQVRDLVEVTEDYVYAATTIVYNPLSLDSLMATAILMNDESLGTINTVIYDRGGLLASGLSDHVIFAGLDPRKEDIDHIVNVQRHVKIYTYRDGVPWHKEHNTHHLSVLRPSDEFFDEITALTDNTVTKQLLMRYNTDDAEKSKVYVHFSGMVDKAIRYCAMMDTEAHSLPFPNPTDAAAAVIAEKAVVFSLRQTIGYAISRKETRYIAAVVEERAYREHNHRVRLTLQKALHFQTYGLGENRKSVATLAVNESDFHEMAYTYQVVGKDIVGYEDIRGYRIWRIWAKDRSVREMIAAYLKPEDRWMEGRFLCVLTKTPAMDIR